MRWLERGPIEAVKTSLPPRDTVKDAHAYDDALAAAGDLASQAAASGSQPGRGMRKAGEECGRQIQALLTGISQDRALYQVLSGLDSPGKIGPDGGWSASCAISAARASTGTKRPGRGSGR